MWDIALPYLPNFFKGFGLLLFLPVDNFGLGIFSKISLSSLIAIMLGPQDFGIQNCFFGFALGVALSLPILLVTEIVMGYLEIASVCIGLNYAAIYDPTTQRESLSQVYLAKLFISTIFFAYHSQTYLDILFSSELNLNTQALFYTTVKIFLALAKFAFPLILVFSIVELFLGIFQRILPALSLQFEIQSIKILLFFTIGAVIVSQGKIQNFITFLSDTIFEATQINEKL